MAFLYPLYFNKQIIGRSGEDYLKLAAFAHITLKNFFQTVAKCNRTGFWHHFFSHLFRSTWGWLNRWRQAPNSPWESVSINSDGSVGLVLVVLLPKSKNQFVSFFFFMSVFHFLIKLNCLKQKSVPLTNTRIGSSSFFPLGRYNLHINSKLLSRSIGRMWMRSTSQWLS